MAGEVRALGCLTVEGEQSALLSKGLLLSD